SQAPLVNSGGGMLSPIVVVDGQVVGTWKRELKKESVVITPFLFAKLKPAERHAVAAAARRYGEFLGMTVVPG
ncbi:MAG TPA: crosslink repair DNA glycosylase YcaQ family protein, partial [Pyrinomonadaceae bacterium]|nr:crosslink repair DNA glycosylase YcaQ family protein [Pyrinomonadaceae bacterium]